MTLTVIGQRTVNHTLFDRLFSSAYRSGWQLYPPDYPLAKDPDVWDKVRRDPVIDAGIELRTAMTVSKDYVIEPWSDRADDKQAAAIVEEMFREMGNFLEARRQLSQASILGRAFAAINSRRKIASYAGGPELPWRVPTYLDPIDWRRWRLVPEHYTDPSGVKRLRSHWELWAVERAQYEKLDDPMNYIKHIYSDEEGRLGYGGPGILESIYFYAYAKAELLRLALQGAGRWARGVLIGKIDGVRDAQTGLPNEAIQEAWLNVFEGLKDSYGMVFDKLDDVSLLQPSMVGHEMVVNLIRYMDDSMTRRLVGSILPSGGGGDVGSNARAVEESNTTEAVLQMDRMKLDDRMNGSIIRDFIFRHNRPNLVAIGLGNARPPKFVTVQEKRHDAERAARVFGSLPRGTKIREDEFYREIGFSPVKEGERFITIDPSGGQAGGIPGLTTPSTPGATPPEQR